MTRLPFALLASFACMLAGGVDFDELAFIDPDGHLVVLYEID